jgi:hypothetical protein
MRARAFHPVLILVALAWMALAFSTAGCAGTLFYTPLVSSPRPLPPRAIEDVEVFAVSPPPRPLVNLGLFQLIAGIDDASIQAMVARIRSDAAARGCDAILITSVDHYRSQNHSPSIQASCVVYTDAGSAGNPGNPMLPGSRSAASAPPATPPGGEAPKSWVAATVGATAAEVRTAPFLVAPLLTTLVPGQSVSVSASATDGWRHAMLPDGRLGYVLDAAVRLSSPPSPPSPP